MSASSARRPRVLVLTPRYPYPVVGGDRLRIYYLCRELAKSCDLTLLSLCDTQHELQSPQPEDGVFSRIERIYMSPWRSRLNVLLALSSSTPLQVAYYRNSRFRQRAHAILQDHDLCLAHLIRTGDMVRATSAAKVLEMTDAISLNYARVRASGKRSDWRTWLYGMEAGRLLDYERRVLRDFNVVTLVSDVDRKFLLEGRELDNVLVCSNGVDLRPLPSRDPAQRERSVVFIGDMRTAQNLDACHYFIEAILPALRMRGNFRFRIIGRMSARVARHFEASAGVEVRANVPSVADAVGNAFAAVAPMRLGAGVQNKILEYMAFGVPVVTSPVGLEGLHARPGEEILVAESPRDYVELLARLFDDSVFSTALARAGRAYVERQHSWTQQLAPMVDAIHRIARCDRTPASEVLPKLTSK